MSIIYQACKQTHCKLKQQQTKKNKTKLITAPESLPGD